MVILLRRDSVTSLSVRIWSNEQRHFQPSKYRKSSAANQTRLLITKRVRFLCILSRGWSSDSWFLYSSRNRCTATRNRAFERQRGASSSKKEDYEPGLDGILISSFIDRTRLARSFRRFRRCCPRAESTEESTDACSSFNGKISKTREALNGSLKLPSSPTLPVLPFSLLPRFLGCCFTRIVPSSSPSPVSRELPIFLPLADLSLAARFDHLCSRLCVCARQKFRSYEAFIPRLLGPLGTW